MNVAIRPITDDDVEMVTLIEREAFPILCPPTPLRREMGNRRVRYLVAWEPRPAEDANPPKRSIDAPSDASPVSLVFNKLVGAVKDRLGFRKVDPSPEYAILGFVGLWFMADEAHITAIAVEEASRRKGIGELLLIGSIDLAAHLESSVVSLEARVSNHAARSLYGKYGFEHMGIRKAYYTDNREDAVIMTTEPIQSSNYQAKFQELKKNFERRYGEPSIILA